MVRMDGAETRKIRIAEVAKIVMALLYQNKEAGWIPFNPTIAKIMVETGLTRGKVLEYLQLKSEEGVFDINELEGRIKRKPETP
jgi:hypothetical protein